MASGLQILSSKLKEYHSSLSKSEKKKIKETISNGEQFLIYKDNFGKSLRSTRGQQNGLTFEEVVLGGLATDKGLFIPENIPQISIQEIERMRPMSFIDLAFEVITKFVGPEDIPTAVMRDIVTRSFSTFRHPEVTPNVKLTNFWVLELFHGPTFAFKDIALQFLGNLFEYFLTRGKYQDSITILGATSGDTGSAAIHGLRGKRNVNCFILYPYGKVTEVQERQMTTILDDNIHCINIDGNFDDAQAIVKAAFADEKFRDEVKLGAINSINWARVLAQITYYFYSWLRATDFLENKHANMLFAVPTGNFGDILAGYYAKKMGLPIEKLVICTNENDVLHRFFETGIYKKQPACLSIAPSMDISISSNFERYLFYLADENPTTLAGWMNEFETTGKVELPKNLLLKAKSVFASAASTKDDIVKAMKTIYSIDSYFLCPHTATSAVAVSKLNLPADRTICLATAHHSKFEEALRLAADDGPLPPRPAELEKLFSMETRTVSLPNSLQSIESFVREKVKSKTMINWPLVIGLSTAFTIGVYAYLRHKK